MRKTSIAFVLFFCTIVFADGMKIFAAAEEGRSDNVERVDPFRFSAAYLHQLGADLDDGGEVKAQRLLFHADWTRRVEEDLRIGVRLIYEYHDYTFSGAGSLAGLNPWGGINRLGLSLPLSYHFQRDWSLFVAPSVEFNGASGASFGDSLVYGGILAVSHRFSPRLRLGLGLGAFAEIEDTKFFPVILVDWKITEKLRLSNPLRPGPTGPAGLEISCRLDRQWEIAAGGAYRSLRFRLGGEGAVPDGVGEDRGFPLWGRISWKHASGLHIDAMAGAIVGGRLEVDDRSGSRLHREEYETAPIFNATLTVPF